MSEQPTHPFGDVLSAFGGFGKLMPGLDFMQQWTKTAGSALPGVGQWVAPTLDPAELDKRIQDLRTVQFWLEQNARMLGMTIQALEVQRMTLGTLQGMNVSLDALRESMIHRPSSPAAAPAPAPATPPPASPFVWPGSSARSSPAAAEAQAPATEPAAPEPPAPPAPPSSSPAAGGSESGMVDPMRWWGSLTQQFANLAAQTMQDALRSNAAAAEGGSPSADAPDAATGATSDPTGPAGAGRSPGRARPSARASGEAASGHPGEHHGDHDPAAARAAPRSARGSRKPR